MPAHGDRGDPVQDLLGSGGRAHPAVTFGLHDVGDLPLLDVRAELVALGHRPRPELELGRRHDQLRLREGVEVPDVVVVEMCHDHGRDRLGCDPEPTHGIDRRHEARPPATLADRRSEPGVDQDRLAAATQYSHTKLPRNWMDFLRDSMNKKELFAFLSSKVVEFNWQPDKAIYVTSGKAVASIGSTIPMQNCNHEEADTRIVVHIVHGLEQGAKTFHVRTVDTDVVVILVATFYDLIVTQPLIDIWVAFGMGKNYRFYHINAICASLGEQQSRALPVFHSFSGCDTTSAFRGKRKKSVWQAWQAYKDVTDTFVYLASHPFQRLDVDADPFQRLERLTVVLYDRTSHLSTVNETRRKLFCQKNRAMDKLSPTRDALLQHIRRVVY